MASEIIVGVYQSRRDADDARERLLAEGIDARRVTIEQGPAEGRAAMPRGGRFLVAVHTDSEAHARAAASILANAGPRVYSLPNAPSAWNEATAGDPPTTSGVDRDPARPEGLLDDAEGLPVEADRARLAQTQRASRNR